MLIAFIARVRYLVTVAVGELVIFNEHMIGKRSVDEIGTEVRGGDQCLLGDSITEVK